VILPAQDYNVRVKTLSALDGLNGQIKFTYHQDQHGFLWLISSYGIDRYDGQEITNVEFPNNFNQSVNLRRIIEPGDGTIWCIGDQTKVKDHNYFYLGNTSVVVVDILSGELIPTDHYFSENNPFKQKQWRSFYTRKNQLYGMDENGFVYHLTKEDGIKKISTYSFLHKSITSWAILPENKIASIYQNEIKIVNPEGDIVKSRAFDPDIRLRKVWISEKGIIEVLTRKDDRNFGYLLNNDLQTRSSFPVWKYESRFHFERSDGLVIQTNNGQLILKDSVGNNLLNIHENLDLGASYWSYIYHPPNSTNIVFQLSEKVHIVDITKNKFRNYLQNESRPVSARAMASGDGYIFENPNCNAYLINQSTGKIEVVNCPFDPMKYSSEGVKTIFNSVSKEFWNLTFWKLWKYNIATKASTEIQTDVDKAFKDLIFSKDFKNCLAMNESTLFKFDSLRNALRPIQIIIEDYEHLKFMGFETIGNKLYVVSNNYIFEWKVNRDELKKIWTIPPIISRSQYLDIYFKDSTNLWFATSNNGIYNWNPYTNKIKNVSKTTKLSNNCVYAIKEDQDGNFWLPTNFGLNKYNPKTEETSNFLPVDGIPNYEFNRFSHHQDKSGNLYFGGLNGITTFDPKDFGSSQSNNERSCILTKVELINTNSGERKRLDIQNQEIEFEKAFSSLELTVNSIDISSVIPIQYQYIIDEDFENWQTSTENQFKFSRHTPGKHTLRIRGNGRDGTWSSNEIKLFISVPFPIHQQFWFYLLLIVVSLFCAFLFYRWRMNKQIKHRQELRREVKRRTESLKKSKDRIVQQSRELSQLDALKSKFFTNISHELRTPLTMILNPLKEIQQQQLSPAEQKEYIDLAKDSGLELQNIVDRILKLSELDSQKIKLGFQNTSTSQIYNHIILPYQDIASDLGIGWNDLGVLHSDEIFQLDFTKLKDVLISLLKNAIKYSDYGDQISVGLKLNEKSISFFVKDEGIGIAPEHQKRIFEKYYQSSSQHRKANGGLGIGLALSKQFVSLMNGTIEIESSPNIGSKFNVEIPVLPASSNQVAHVSGLKSKLFISQTAQISGTDESKQTILVVEDHELLNFFLASSLSKEYNVLSATNGRTALEIIGKQKNKIDLIITDWMMPQLDGPTLIKSLRSNPKSLFIPIIMLSARAGQIDQLEALKIGIDDYLTKPFDNEILKARIRNLIANYQVRKQQAVEDKNQIEFLPGKAANDSWLDQLKTVISEQLSSEFFGVSELAIEMNLSDRQLSRKLKGLVGMTPGNYIKEFRLLKAKAELEGKTHFTVSEIAYACGFTNVEYFSKIFKQRFGFLPSSLMKSNKTFH